MNGMGLREIPRKRLMEGAVLIGAVFIFVGLFRGIKESSQVQVEYIKNEETMSGEKGETILVDVEGGVEIPGVYEIRDGSRMKDALLAAGGLSGSADREIIAKAINLAQPVRDGQKIYVPIQGDSGTGVGYSEIKNEGGMININSATESELDTLTGIGSVRAKAIIDNRPYVKVDDLVEKGVLTKSILEGIRESITVY